MNNQTTQPQGRNNTIVLICLIAVALGGYMLLQWQKPSNENVRMKKAATGLPAPDFVLPMLDGGDVRLSDYKGKIVFLNIWATWCAPCREEMPSMEKLYQQLKGKDFEILAVSIDAKGSQAVGHFVKQHKLTFPVLLDADAKVTRLYNTTGVPETFIIDKNGLIVSKIIGYQNWAAPRAVQFLEDLIRKPSGSNS